jgi:transcriptional regulator with XRE-family HTH domain
MRSELRLARVGANLSQGDVGKACGLSHAAIGRIERGDNQTIDIVTLARVLAVVGFDLSVRAYPHATAQRDAAHAALLERLHVLLPIDLPWNTEVPFPNPGDLRSWDARTRVRRLRVAIEAETRVRDGQELQRRLTQKRRDGGADRLILLLADTRNNRVFMRDYGATLASVFPAPGATALEALQRGDDPGDAIILLSGTRVSRSVNS